MINEKNLDIRLHEGSFLEIIRIGNGFCIYDFSIARFQHGMDGRRPIPIAVFNTKEQVLRWLTDNWRDIPDKDLFS